MKYLEEHIIVLQFEPDHMEEEGAFVVGEPAVEDAVNVPGLAGWYINTSSRCRLHRIMTA